jgi:hypothetical protein
VLGQSTEKKIEKSHLAKNKIGQMVFCRKSNLKNQSNDRNDICSFDQKLFSKIGHLTESSFERELFSKNGHLTKRSFDRKVI